MVAAPAALHVRGTVDISGVLYMEVGGGDVRIRHSADAIRRTDADRCGGGEDGALCRRLPLLLPLAA